MKNYLKSLFLGLASIIAITMFILWLPFGAPAEVSGQAMAPAAGPDITGVVLTSNSGGLPVNKSSVSLWNENRSVNMQVQTDVSGAYGLTGVPSGTFYMKAIAPISGSGSGRADSATIPVTFTTGVTQQINFNLRMPWITGTVLLPSSGSLVTGTNTTLYRDIGSPGSPDWRSVDNYRTNYLGVFRLPNVEAASYRIVASPPGRAGFDQFADSNPIEFTYTGITLPLGTISLTGVSITGTVTAPNGVPQSGVWVDLFNNVLPNGPLGADDPGQTPIKGMVTDGSGNFKFGGLTAGAYKLVARAGKGPYFDSDGLMVLYMGFDPVLNANLSLRSPNFSGGVIDPLGNPVFGSRVDLKTGEMGPVIDSRTTDSLGHFAFAGLITGTSYFLTAWPPNGSPFGESAAYGWTFVGATQVTLTLTLADLSGVVRTLGGSPLANAGINLYTADHFFQRNSMSGSDGTFKFSGLVTNTYKMQAMPGPGSEYGNSPEYQLVYTGTALSGVVLTVTAPFLTGTVTTPDLVTPVPWAGVNLHTKDYQISTFSSTDQNGRFRLGGVGDGSYILEASPQMGGMSPWSQSVPVAITVTNGVAVNVTQPFTVPLTGASITGTVLAPDGGTPISMTHVMLHDANYLVQSNTSTNMAGTFSFGGIAPGSYVIEADAPPMSRYSKSLPVPVVVESGVTHYYAVTLTIPSLTGLTVKDVGGMLVPVPNAGVDVRLKDNPAIAFFSGSNMAGQFAFGGLAPGIYTLSAHTPMQSTGLVSPPSKVITIEAGIPISETIIFTQSSKHIAGTVARSNGDPVADAMVFANKEGGAGWANGMVDNQGRYTIDVSPGAWMVSVGPAMPNQAADWTYGKPAVRVDLPDTAEPITRTLNFTVTSAGSIVRGRLLKPDGLPPSQANVSLHSLTGFGNGVPVSGDGTFQIPLPPGTYMFNVWLMDTSLSGPRLEPIVLGESETRDLGTLVLVGRNSQITGYVRDSSGRGVSGVDLNASLRRGMEGGGGPGDWARTTSITDGVFSIYVLSGTWELHAMPSADSRYVESGTPTRVDVADNTTVADVVITVSSADSELTGSVVDALGNPLSDIYGFTNAHVGNGPGFRSYGGPINGGTFTIRLPSGTYDVDGGLPPGSSYSIARRSGVVVSGTTSITLTASEASAWITGGLVGDASSGLQAGVFAAGPQGQASTQVDLNTGRYSLRVAAGEWFVNAWLDPSSGYVLDRSADNRVTVGEGLTRTVNLTVTSANSKIWGIVSDPDGGPLAGAWVGAMLRDASGRPRPPYGAETNSSGVYTITVPNGTFEVNTFLPPERGYLPPAPVTATVSSGTPVVQRNLQFRRPDSAIYGTVTLSGTLVPDGMVRAFSDSGARAYTDIRAGGAYSMPVTSDDTWHIQAVREYSSTLYQSQVYSVTVGSGLVSQDLVLSASGMPMPNSTSVSFDASAMRQITLGDGTQIIIPAGALAVSGTVTVSALPKGAVSMEGSARPIGLAYDLSATDSNGANISRFLQNVSIILHYTQDQLDALGITEDQVMGSYWDSATGSWRTINNVVQDESSDTLRIDTDHFSSWTITGGSSSEPVTSPDLSTSVKTASPNSNIESGNTVTYTITMTNTGSADAAAMMTDTLPSEVTYVASSVSATSGLATEDHGVIGWSGTVTATQAVLVTFRVTLNGGLAGGLVITNTATINDGAGTLTSKLATITTDDSPTPTPTATNTPVPPSATATGTPSPTPTVTGTATGTATPTMTPTATSTATATVTPTATSVAATATATVTATPTFSNSVYLPLVVKSYSPSW